MNRYNVPPSYEEIHFLSILTQDVEEVCEELAMCNCMDLAWQVIGCPETDERTILEALVLIGNLFLCLPPSEKRQSSVEHLRSLLEHLKNRLTPSLLRRFIWVAFNIHRDMYLFKEIPQVLLFIPFFASALQQLEDSEYDALADCCWIL